VGWTGEVRAWGLQFDTTARVTGVRASDRVIAQLMTEMDGINPSKHVFIIGATNR